MQMPLPLNPGSASKRRGVGKIRYSEPRHKIRVDFKTATKKLEWQLLQDTIDICKIKLAEPLLPGASITISTPFKVKIPSAVLSRLGHNEQAYFITQWYPKPAVYDKNGWNYFSYLDKG